MANYQNIIAAIESVIKQNGNQEITGQILQQSLVSIIHSLGAQYQFAGFADSETNPGTPDHKVAYLAGPGTYPNFNAYVVPDGFIAAFLYDGNWDVQFIGFGGGGGGGTSFIPEPDDLTLSLSVLKFANRSYNSANPNGMGYKILRKNMTFAEQVTDENTIYEIRYDFDLNNAEISLPADSILFFNGGTLDNGTIVGDGAQINTCENLPVFGRSCKLLGTWKNKEFFVDWWNCYADGTHDDYAVLKGIAQTINANGGGKVVFGFQKTYYFALTFCDQSSSTINTKDILFDMTTNCVLDLNGSTLKCAPNDYIKFSYIRFTNCNFLIKNGFIVGDKVNHDYSFGGTQEWGWGIEVRGATGKIENMDISMMLADAIYIWKYYNLSNMAIISSGDVVVENCKLHNCRRQGISFTGNNFFEIKNCDIYNIGTYDGITGANPMSGIDLEFEWAEHTAGTMLIHDNRFRDCDGGGISCATAANRFTELKLHDCSFYDALLQFALYDSNAKYEIRDLHIEGNYKRAGRVFKFFPNIKNIYIKSSNYIYGGQIGIWENVVVDAPDPNFYINAINGGKFTGCTFKNFHGESGSGSIPGYGYNGGIRWWEPTTGSRKDVNVEFIDCTLENVLLRSYQKANGTPAKFTGCLLNDVAIQIDDNRPFVFKGCTINNPLFRPTLSDAPKLYFYNCDVYNENDVFDFSLSSANLYRNGKYGFSVAKRRFHNCKLNLRNWYQSGYFGDSFIHAYNCSIKFDSCGNVSLSAANLVLENCYIVTNKTETQMTLQNSTRVDLTNVFWASAETFTISDANVKAMANKLYKQQIAGNYTVAATTANDYIYFAFPLNWGTPQCEAHPIEKVGEVFVSDEFGVVNYGVYKTTETNVSGTLAITLQTT